MPQAWHTKRDLARQMCAPELAVDGAILSAWCAGFNTYDIGKLVGEPECLVASRIPRVLEQRRENAA